MRGQINRSLLYNVSKTVLLYVYSGPTLCFFDHPSYDMSFKYPTERFLWYERVLYDHLSFSIKNHWTKMVVVKHRFHWTISAARVSEFTLRPDDVSRLTVDAWPMCWWLPPPWGCSTGWNVKKFNVNSDHGCNHFLLEGVRLVPCRSRSLKVVHPLLTSNMLWKC